MNTIVLFKQASLIIGGVLLGVAINVALAQQSWQGPQNPPPDNGNVFPPINTGDNSQAKEGNLTINLNGAYPIGLWVGGQAMRIPQSSGASVSGEQAGMIRFNASSGKLEVFTGGSWTPVH